MDPSIADMGLVHAPSKPLGLTVIGSFQAFRPMPAIFHVQFSRLTTHILVGGRYRGGGEWNRHDRHHHSKPCHIDYYPFNVSATLVGLGCTLFSGPSDSRRVHTCPPVTGLKRARLYSGHHRVEYSDIVGGYESFTLNKTPTPLPQIQSGPGVGTTLCRYLSWLIIGLYQNSMDDNTFYGLRKYRLIKLAIDVAKRLQRSKETQVVSASFVSSRSDQALILCSL